MKRLFTCSVMMLLMLAASGAGTTPSDRSKCYQSDLGYFLNLLETAHPNPYSRFGSKKKFERAKQQLANEVSKVTNDADFILTLNRFLSNLGDGHTTVSSMPNHSQSSKKSLPIHLGIAEDGIYVRTTSKQYSNLKGLRLKSVNGIPITRLVERAKLTSPSENIYGCYQTISRAMTKGVLLEPLLGLHDSLLVSVSNGKEKIAAKLPLLTQTDIERSPSVLSLQQQNGLLFWDMVGSKNDIGYFRWNSILSREVLESTYKSAPNSIEGYLSWAYSFLKKARTGDVKKDIEQVPALYEQLGLLLDTMQHNNARHLIIDLRYNSGGMTPLVNPLLYLLYGDKFLNFDFETEYRTRISLPYLRKQGLTSIDEYNSRYSANLKIDDILVSSIGGYDKSLTLDQKRATAQQGFDGFGQQHLQNRKQLNIPPKVIVLVSPQTFSAAFHLTFFLYKMGAQVLGVTPSQAGNTFMETTPFSLPSTGITGSISNSEQILFKNDKAKGYCLHPTVPMRIADFAAYHYDENAEVLKAIDLIEKERAQSTPSL